MTLDERIHALTDRVEPLASMHRDSDISLDDHEDGIGRVERGEK